MNTLIKIGVLVLFVVVMGDVDRAGAVYIPNRPDLNINTDTQGNLNVNLPGRNITTGTDGTTIDYLGGRTITKSADGTVQLQDNGRLITIRNDQDLDAYASVVIEDMPAITDVEVGSGTITIEYEQPAKFLGIFGSSLNATVIVKNGGTVEIDLPWYSFLYRKNAKVVRRAVEAQLRSGVQSGVLNLSVIGSGGDTSVTLSNSAQVIGIVSTTVNTQVSASGSVTPTAAPTRTTTPARTPTPISNTGTTIASFVGSWSGRFSAASTAAAYGCPGGSVSFSVTSDGKLQGPVYIDGYSATAFYGGGTVDNNGTMTGGWSVNTSGVIKQGTISFSGKLLASGTGSGSWNVPGGCFGSYSVTRR